MQFLSIRQSVRQSMWTPSTTSAAKGALVKECKTDRIVLLGDALMKEKREKTLGLPRVVLFFEIPPTPPGQLEDSASEV